MALELRVGAASQSQLATVPLFHSRTYSRRPRKRKALAIADAELKLMARAAIKGDNSQPVHGNNTPAATGMSSATDLIAL